MISKHKYITFMVAATTLALTACVTDDSTESNITLPTLSIEGSDAETMPVHNIYLGNECVLKPEITYTGNDTLTYHWQVGSYANSTKGELQDAGTGAELRYNFTAGGSYYAHLTVTDGKVGKSADYQINVNRTFEEGYLLSATDADGKGNLTFVKILTPEEEAAGTGDVVMEHAMERMNENLSEEGLVGAITCSYSNYPSPDVTRLLVSTKDHCYFLDPNELTLLSIANYDEVYPGFSASNFYIDDYAMTPYCYDNKMKKFVHLNVKNQFPFEYSTYVGFQPEGIVQGQSSSWGRKSVTTFYLDYTNNAIAKYNAYAAYYGGSYFPTTEDLLSGQELITAFSGYGPGSNYVTPWYIISQDKDSVCLWMNETANGMTANDFKSQKIKRTADLAIPQKGTWLLCSPTHRRLFYAIDNRVYVLLPQNAFALPTLSQYAIQFPDGEEVTYMETRFDNEKLLIATYNNSTKRGSFYVYSCADVRTDNAAAVKPDHAWRNCTGRVSKLIYKASIQ